MDGAERGPNYNWRHEAEHYQKECADLRELLYKLEASSERIDAENEKLRAALAEKSPQCLDEGQLNLNQILNLIYDLGSDAQCGFKTPKKTLELARQIVEKLTKAQSAGATRLTFTGGCESSNEAKTDTNLTTKQGDE